MSPPKSSGVLAELSAQLANAVERAGQSLVAIHARRRIPSSGIIWREDIMVAASHTVRREGEVSVTLPSGDPATATIAGRDPATDLIALRLEGSDVPAAARGDAESLRVGTLVVAVGRPGRNVTASFGIVSAVAEGWRTWQGARLDRLIRLDLAIYDGFSGGPVVDAGGGVLGLSNSALARGTPVALPATTVDRVLDELLERGHVRRAYLGIAVHPVALGAALIERLGIAQQTALVVVSVAERSPAERGGVLVGDVLLDAGGEQLRHPSDLLDALSGTKNDAPLELSILRGGTRRSLSVTPGDRHAAGPE
jgi:S1-C subfamily serine protease